MKSIAILCTAIAYLTVAGSALAGGEAKNQAPFTCVEVAQLIRDHAADTTIQGEPKNQWPFTRAAADLRSPQPSATSGPAYDRSEGGLLTPEPKNTSPFTRPVVVPTVVVHDAGFDWAAAGIGAAGAIGLLAIGIGLASLLRPRRVRQLAAGAH